MTEKEIKALVIPLAAVGTITVLSVIGYISESRRLKKEGKSLRMQNEAKLINRDTLEWLSTDARKLGFPEFSKQFNERIDFAVFIANH